MLGRCCRKKDKDYNNYGGRGITICKRWTGKGKIDNFIEDMGYKPEPHPTEGKYSIDRINNDKGYYKDNCRWATSKMQAYNKRIKIKGYNYYNNKSLYNNIAYDNTRKKWIVSVFDKKLGRTLDRITALKIYNAYIEQNPNPYKIKREIPNIKLIIIENDKLKSLINTNIKNINNILILNKLILERNITIIDIFKEWNIDIEKINFVENVLNSNTIIISYF